MGLFSRLLRGAKPEPAGAPGHPEASDAAERVEPDGRLTAESLRRLLGSATMDVKRAALARVEAERPTDPDIARVLLAARTGEPGWIQIEYHGPIAALGSAAVGPVIETLRRADHHSDADGLAAILGLIGRPAITAVAALARDANASRDAQTGASRALYNIGKSLGAEAAAELLPILREAVRAGGHASYWSAEAIGHLGPAGREAIPDLLDAVERKTAGARGAMSALTALGADPLLFVDCYREPSVIAERLVGACEGGDPLTAEAFNRGCALLVEWCVEIRPVSNDGRLYAGTDLQLLDGIAAALGRVLAADAAHRRVKPELLERMLGLNDAASTGYGSEGADGSYHWVEESRVSFADVREVARERLRS